MATVREVPLVTFRRKTWEETLGTVAVDVEDANDKLDRAEDKLDDLVAKHDQVTARLDAVKRDVLRVAWRMGGLVCGSIGLAAFGLGYVLRTSPVRGAEAEPVGREVPAVDVRAAGQGTPDEKSLGAGLDGGTELAELVTKAVPMPKQPLPRQRAAPCPEGIDEFDGYCWSKWSLTPAQVKAGACEDDGLYEPSPGWCREHRAGFRPYRAARRNNSVEQ